MERFVYVIPLMCQAFFVCHQNDLIIKRHLNPNPCPPSSETRDIVCLDQSCGPTASSVDEETSELKLIYGMASSIFHGDRDWVDHLPKFVNCLSILGCYIIYPRL